MTRDDGWIKVMWGPTSEKAGETFVVCWPVEHGSIKKAVEEATERLVESMATDYARMATIAAKGTV